MADYVGTLVGELVSGTVINCHVEAATVSGRDYVGGLVGRSSGTIEDCTVDVNVVGENGVGGLCGSNSGTLTNCYSVGSVTGGGNLGGLCHVEASLEIEQVALGLLGVSYLLDDLARGDPDVG